MSEFKWGVSHRANRDELKSDPPTYKEIIRTISTNKNIKAPERAYLACLIMLGARSTEVLNTKQKDYKFYWNVDSAGPYDTVIDMVEYDNLRKVYGSLEYSKVVVTMKILKQRKEVLYKKVSCIRDATFVEPFDWLVQYFKTLPVDPEAKVFPFTRNQCWFICKKHLGQNYFNHWFRHAVASNDIASGMPIALVQKKLGHKNIVALNTYIHMRTQDTEDALKKVYGDALQKFPVKTNGPLSPTHLMAGLAATNQIGERCGPPYYKKEAIIMVNDKKMIVPLDQNARVMRDKLRKENPEYIKQVHAERDKYFAAQAKKGIQMPIAKGVNSIDDTMIVKKRALEASKSDSNRGNVQENEFLQIV